MKNRHLNALIAGLVCSLVQFVPIADTTASEKTIAEISLTEPVGLNRPTAYAEVQLQQEIDLNVLNIVAVDKQTAKSIPCQVFDIRSAGENELQVFKIIFRLKHYITSNDFYCIFFYTRILYR